MALREGQILEKLKHEHLIEAFGYAFCYARGLVVVAEERGFEVARSSGLI